MILHITSQKSSFLLKKFSGEPRYGLRRLLLLYFENLEIFEAAQRFALCPVGVLVGGIGHHPGALPGRDNAALTEPARTQATAGKRALSRQLGARVVGRLLLLGH
jgi:hypothetical protein